MAIPTSPKMTSLRERLLQFSRVSSDLVAREAGGAIRCFACAHRCLIHEGRDGICKVRSNIGGELRVPWGYAAGVACDPVEKKPFFHVLPGSLALSFGMLGCDLHCAYCQNWLTSQALRDPAADAPATPISAERLVRAAEQWGARILTSTYNEPLITSEWAVEVFKQARARGLVTSYVSNGNATPEVLEYLRPHTDLYKIDLKGFQDRRYRELGTVLDRVLETIRRVHAMGFWLEVVTLVVPGFNDEPDEIRRLCDFLVEVSPDIPWHATAFRQQYKMRDRAETEAEKLVELGEIGKRAGLRYVYLGNLPGEVGEWENTYCPRCRTLLVQREGFRVLATSVTAGACPKCGERIPGRWD